MVYTVEVRVQYQGNTDILRLGPRNRLGVTANKLVEAQLVGDFASFSENPSLQDHTLFIPAVRQGRDVGICGMWEMWDGKMMGNGRIKHGK